MKKRYMAWFAALLFYSSMLPLSATGESFNYNAHNLTGDGTGAITGFDNITNTGYGGTLRTGDLIAKGPMVDVRAFGADSTGVADSSPAFTAALAYMKVNHLETLYAPDAYYFATPVTLIAEDNTNIRLTGNSMAGWIWDTNPARPAIKGAPGMAALFLVTANAFGLEVDHLRFNGGSITTGVVSAFKFTSEGMPARPLNFHNNHFTGFDKVIYALEIAGGVNAGICQVNIENNTFQGNTYALYGEGDLQAIMNLRFVGNVSEQGGKIKTTDYAAGGTWYIADNLMEGQSDAIQISAGLCHMEIVRNYFESNTGDIVRVTVSNPGSTLLMKSNWYSNCSNARVSISGFMFYCNDDFSRFGILFSPSGLGRKSFTNINKYAFDANPVTTINLLDVSSLSGIDSPQVALNGTYVAHTTTPIITPKGVMGSQTFTQYQPLASVVDNLAVGDFVIVTAFIESVTATLVGIVLYDELENNIAEVGPNYYLPPPGEFSLITAAIKVPSIVSGHYNVRFQVEAGTSATVSDMYVYKVAAPTGADFYYPYLPSPEHQGVATIDNLATYTVVTHGMGFAPRNISVVPTDNVGYLWVSSVGATTFIINCSTAPTTGNKTVYWRAN